MARESINIRAGFDLAAFRTSAQNLTRSLRKTGKKLERTGKSFTRNLTAPLVGLGALAVREFAMLEQSMAKVKAVSGATAKEFKDLTDLSKQLGLTTQFTASEVADLELNYAKLGFSVGEIEQITAATLDLALATGEDLASSAQVAGNTLRGFALDASEMLRVTDVMAAAFSRSALDLGKFSIAMSKIAPVANAAGISLERASAMMAVLADSGVEASTIGTSTTKILVRLAKSGLSFEAAMEKIRNSTNKVKTAFDLFGKTAISSAIILSDQEEKLKDVALGLQNVTGETRKMAKTMEATFSGSMKKMQSAASGLAISFGEKLAPLILKVSDKITEIAISFSQLSDETKDTIIKLAGFAAAIGPILIGLGLVSKLIAAIAAGPIVALVAGIAALAVGISIANLEIGKNVKETTKLTRAQVAVADSTDKYKKSINQEKDELKALFRELKKTKKGTKERNDLLVFANKIYGTTLTNIEDEAKFINQLDTAYVDLVKAMSKKIAFQIKEEAVSDLIREQIGLQETLEGLYGRLEEASESSGEGAFNWWRTVNAEIVKQEGLLGENIDAIDKIGEADLFKEKPDIPGVKDLDLLGKEAEKTSKRIKQTFIKDLPFDDLILFITNVGKSRRALEKAGEVELDIIKFKPLATSELLASVDKLISDLDEKKAIAAAKAKEVGEAISSAVVSGLISLTTDVSALIGTFLSESLQGEGAALNNLGRGLLDALGGFMQQLGASMIAIGIGLKLLKDSIKTLNPTTALIGGALLVAAGAAISSLSKAGLEGGASVTTPPPGPSTSFGGGGSVSEIVIDGRKLIVITQRELGFRR